MNLIKKKILGGFFSSTMWFGFVIMLIQWLSNNTQMLVGLVPENYQELAGYMLGALIWFFRMITDKPVEDKLPSKKKTSTETLEDAIHQSDDDFTKDF